MMSLKDVYKDYFKVGASVHRNMLDSCKELICSQFNTVTCDSEMKYSHLCDVNGNYHFGDADKLYNFAWENGIEMRGHNLIWHIDIPTEKFESMSANELETRITEHMKIVNDRYPELSCWDVINEAVDGDGNYLRDTVWKRKFGDDYFIRMYDIARKYLPHKQLVYNDYNEFVSPKREYIYKLVSQLKERGLVDAVGLQCHLMNISTISMDEMKRTYELFAKLGLRIHVTEMDISLPELSDPTVYVNPPAEMIEKQAKMYGDMFALFREYHELIDSVTFWGVSDEQSWLNHFIHKRENWPLLFDKNHKPKEAFYRVVQF